MLTVDTVFMCDRDAAIAALTSVGGVHLPGLDLEVVHPVAGRVQRVFAVCGNVVLDGPSWENPLLRAALMAPLERPDNAAVHERLASGALDFTPVSKATVLSLVDPLLSLGLHLPWSYKMRNFDLGIALARLKDEGPLHFEAFYHQQVAFREATGGVEILLDRLFSMPVTGDLSGTWQAMHQGERLDEEVALVIEANHR